MADISINPVTRRVQYTGNTGLGPFAFTFNILADADIAVYKNTTLLTLTSEYTVSTNANGTGSITLTGSGNGTALISSDVLTIIGARQLERTTDFVAGGDFFAASINEQLDSQVIMSQQLDEKLSRTLKVNPGDEFIDLELPLKDDRASKYLAFNSDGDPVAVSGTSSTIIVSAFGETLIDDTNAAAALVTLGLSATASELNIMDGVTATTAEINKLDGVTWTLADYNSLTSTAAELNVLDGITGIATQSDAETGTASDKLMTPERTNEAIQALVPGGIGDDQTWQDVSSSRANNTTYTNTTGKPIMVNFLCPTAGNTTVTATASVGVVNGGSTDFLIVYDNSSSLAGGAGSFIVPIGATYKVNCTSGVSEWHELR